jgi:hypothetical protein
LPPRTAISAGAFRIGAAGILPAAITPGAIVFTGLDLTAPAGEGAETLDAFKIFVGEIIAVVVDGVALFVGGIAAIGAWDLAIGGAFSRSLGSAVGDASDGLALRAGKSLVHQVVAVVVLAVADFIFGDEDAVFLAAVARISVDVRPAVLADKAANAVVADGEGVIGGGALRFTVAAMVGIRIQVHATVGAFCKTVLARDLVESGIVTRNQQAEQGNWEEQTKHHW